MFCVAFLETTPIFSSSPSFVGFMARIFLLSFDFFLLPAAVVSVSETDRAADGNAHLAVALLNAAPQILVLEVFGEAVDELFQQIFVRNVGSGLVR